jgi:hypothetical protein
MPKN